MADPTWPGASDAGVEPRDDLSDRYEVGDRLGRGGMGEVFVAEDLRLDREVALKAILNASPSDEEVRRFLLEARVTGRLDHPHVPPVYDLGTGPQGVYFTMKRLDGRTLSEVVDAGTLTLRQRLQVFGKVCDAVAYAHSRGVLHRDLKPDNVMVGAFGQVYVLDWGLAKVRGQLDPLPDSAPGGSGDSGLTAHGAILGTPAYMPPEQAGADPEAFDERSDVYGLGAILYAILTGWPPYDGPVEGVVAALRGRRPPAPPSARAKVPRELEAIVLKAIAMDPNERYQSAGDLKDDVERWLDGQPVHAVRYTLSQRALKWAGRHRRWVAGGVVAASVAAAAAIVTLTINLSAVGLALNASIASERRTREALGQAHAALALAHLEAGRPALAVDALERARASAPDSDDPALELIAAELAHRFPPADLTWRKGSPYSRFDVSADGTLALIANTGEVTVRRVPTGEIFMRTKTGVNIVAARLLGDGARVAGYDSEGWKVLDLPSGELLHAWGGPGGEYEGVRAFLTGDGARLVVSGPGFDAEVVELERGERGCELGRMVAQAMSDDGRVLLAGRSSGLHRALRDRRFWSLETCQPIGGDPGEGHVALSADGSVYAHLSGQTVEVRRTTTGQVLWQAPSAGGSLTFLAESDWVAVASADHALRVYDALTGQILRTHPILDGPSTSIGELAASRDAGTVLALSSRLAQVWDVAPRTPTLQALRRLTTADVTPDGELAVVGGESGAALVDWRTGQVLDLLDVGGVFVRDVHVVDDRRFLVAGRDGSVWMFDLTSGEALGKFHVGEGRIAMGAVLWRDELIAASDDGAVVRLDLASGRPRGELRGNIRSIWSISLSPDGRHLAAIGRGHTDPFAEVWDLQTGTLAHAPAGGTSGYRGAWSADGEELVVGGGHGYLERIRWRERRDIPLERATQMVQSVARGGSRDWIVAGQYDGRLDWLLADGPRVTLAHAGASVLDMTFVPGHDVLLTASADGRLRAFDLDRARIWADLAPVLGPEEHLGQADGERWLALARAAALRGDFGLALERYARADDPDPMELARVAGAAGDIEALRVALDRAEGAVSPTTLAVWRRFAERAR